MAATPEPGLGKLCPTCGEHRIAAGDFVCRFCFGTLPDSIKRKLRFARGRADEPKKKEEALRWLSKRRRSA